jgi:hypothetical protein
VAGDGVERGLGLEVAGAVVGEVARGRAALDDAEADHVVVLLLVGAVGVAGLDDVVDERPVDVFGLEDREQLVDVVGLGLEPDVQAVVGGEGGALGQPIEVRPGPRG